MRRRFLCPEVNASGRELTRVALAGGELSMTWLNAGLIDVAQDVRTIRMDFDSLDDPTVGDERFPMSGLFENHAADGQRARPAQESKGFLLTFRCDCGQIF